VGRHEPYYQIMLTPIFGYGSPTRHKWGWWLYSIWHR